MSGNPVKRKLEVCPISFSWNFTHVTIFQGQVWDFQSSYILNTLMVLRSRKSSFFYSASNEKHFIMSGNPVKRKLISGTMPCEFFLEFYACYHFSRTSLGFPIQLHSEYSDDTTISTEGKF